MMPLDEAREASAFADADHVHLVGGFELVDQNSVTLLQIVIARPHSQLAQEFHTVGTRLLEMTGRRLAHARRFGELYQSELHGVVTIRGRRLALDYDAGSGFQQRDWHSLPVRPEHLAHPNFLS